MDELKFRDLRADEIEVRVAMVKSNGLSLLLYKDARCDMNILDETVGAMNWQKHYALIDGQLFCEVSIWDEKKAQWISKQDVGVESNTEAEKGRASDAQKRSAFAWGIGRELYTAPFIWVKAADCEITNGKCYDKFIVQSITIEDKKITSLTIYDETTKKVVFSTNAPKKTAAKKTTKAEPKAAEPQTPDVGIEIPDIDYRAELRNFIKANNIDPNQVIYACKLTQTSTNDEYAAALIYAKRLVNRQGA